MLSAAFDPQAFRSLGHHVIDLLADHLVSVQHREGAVLPAMTPIQALTAWPSDFSPQGGEDPLALMADVLRGANHLQHPRYVGHQCAAPLPLAALVGTVRDLLNNGCAIYEMGPVGMAMERAVVRWLLACCGMDGERGDGVLTHGGSAGNLTALLAARQHAADWDIWEEGHRQGSLGVLVSDQAHYSIRRSVQVLGLGGSSVLPVETDGQCRMRPQSLESALARMDREGRRAMAVVACAGSTATGSIDPLEAIADICAQRNLWLHVDGAHSGAMVVSPRLRPLLRGIERADSVVIDFHKMLMVPSLATAVLFRQGEHSYETFSQQASYLFDHSANQEWYNLAHRTLECTKRALGMELYLLLKVLGTDVFSTFLEDSQALARAFAAQLRARPHWRVAVEPESNIVCFRYEPSGVEDLEGLQARLREQVVQEGSFYLVKTTLWGHVWLRTALMNPLTSEADMEALLDRLEALAGTGPE